MHDAPDGDQRNARLKKGNDERFALWLAEPMTRMGLSMIPTGENKDALQLLLRSAFDAGVGCGQGAFAAEMLESFLKRDRKDAK